MFDIVSYIYIYISIYIYIYIYIYRVGHKKLCIFDKPYFPQMLEFSQDFFCQRWDTTISFGWQRHLQIVQFFPPIP